MKQMIIDNNITGNNMSFNTCIKRGRTQGAAFMANLGFLLHEFLIPLQLIGSAATHYVLDYIYETRVVH